MIISETTVSKKLFSRRMEDGGLWGIGKKFTMVVKRDVTLHNT